jgi:hypothetical protein
MFVVRCVPVSRQQRSRLLAGSSCPCNSPRSRSSGMPGGEIPPGPPDPDKYSVDPEEDGPD